MARGMRFLAVLGFVLGLAPLEAEANFHLMVIEEVYPGSYRNPDAQYVVLRTTAAGQNVLTGHQIHAFDVNGAALPDFGIFNRNPTNAASGARYIMATQAAVSLFQFTATTVVTGSLPFPDGRICFAEFGGQPVDCVAYGAYDGDNTNYGTPAPALQLQRALKRIRTLSPHNNSTDYSLGAPLPTDENNLQRPDGDGDGIPNVSDCAPTNASTYFAPMEVTNLAVDRVPGQPFGFITTLAWDDQDLLVGPATVYDLMVQQLTDPGVPMPYTTASCLAANLAMPPSNDPAPDPPVGVTRLYLVRATNGCGDGTYGNWNPGVIPSPPPDPRDPLDVPATTPCP